MRGRTPHPTPRHLEDPLLILGLTVGQWAAVAIGLGLAWAVLNVLPPGWPWRPRLFLTIIAAGAPLLCASAAAWTGVGVGRLARHLWTYWTSPRVYVPGPPSKGPTRIALYDGAPPADEGADL